MIRGSEMLFVYVKEKKVKDGWRWRGRKVMRVGYWEMLESRHKRRAWTVH